KKLIVGMKYTEYDLLNLLRVLKVAGKRIAIFAGSDVMTFTNLEFGGSGGVIGVANVAPKLASSVLDEFKHGNLEAARLAQSKLLPIIVACSVGIFSAGLKEAMRMVGMLVGGLRSPLQCLTGVEPRSV